MKADIVIVGSGVAGLYCALNFPVEKNILIITKKSAIESDSYLAQGGICVLRDDEDFDNYLEDTMRAGHFENDEEAVKIMISSSREIISDLIAYGVRFEKEQGSLKYTKEAAHSAPRILYHEDITGQEITGTLLEHVKERDNIKIMEYTTMLDIIKVNYTCRGIVVENKAKEISVIEADYVIWATGGIGGLFESTTNYAHLTGDAIAIALRHGIELKDANYIQIHPTTFYSTKPGRRFLISESVRGEGAVLLNKDGHRFVNELLPRDLLTTAIQRQMELDETNFVWLSMVHFDASFIRKRFPNIYHYCLEEGFDITKEPIPVTPAQHYYMGGVKVDRMSKTNIDRLYAIGETSCNGVHGANRLASNSLLEALVFAKRSAVEISNLYKPVKGKMPKVKLEHYKDIARLEIDNKALVLQEIERINNNEQPYNDEVKCG